jgi:hypothetical protein
MYACEMQICVIVVWNNFIGIKFHFYHLATILWGNSFVFSFINNKVFYKKKLLYYKGEYSDEWFCFSSQN